MYSSNLKRYIDLKQRKRVDLRIYWYTYLKTTLGSMQVQEQNNKFFIKFSNLINLLFYGFKLSQLAMSLNLKQISLSFILGSVLKTEVRSLRRLLSNHSLGRRIKNRLIRNLNNNNFVPELMSHISLGFRLRAKSKSFFFYSKRWY